MKRIVDGVTYNTQTSTVLAKSRWDETDRYSGLQKDCDGTLYQTRGGAFFLHVISEWTEVDGPPDAGGDFIRKTKDEFVPLTSEAANKWIMTGDVEVFHNPFEDPPEAAAEGEPGATIYIRVPVSLKQRVDAAAAKEQLSGNAWVMRCVEQCLKRSLATAP